MTKVVYEIVQHDGGWAYTSGGVFSETFKSHDLARTAAERAAREQEVPGGATVISFQDSQGEWHQQAARGNDRPQTSVKG